MNPQSLVTPSRFKFRAWYSGEMIEVGKLDFFTDGQIHVNDELVGAVLMQSTGSLDKNGKLIYEGDLLQRQKKSGEFYKKIYEVYFSARGWEDVDLAEEKVVIGNIYENPEFTDGDMNVTPKEL